MTEEALERAEKSELWAQNLVYAGDVKLASRAWEDGDLRQFTEYLDRHLPAHDRPDLRGFEWHYLRQLPRSEHVDVAAGGEALYFVCYSPDGRLLATAGEGATVRVYETGTYQEQVMIETGQGEVNGLAFGPDGRSLASAGDDGTVRIWDLAKQDEIRVIQAHTDEAYQVLFTPDGRLLVSCGIDPVIRLWDPQTGEALGVLERHTRAVEAMALAPDGRTLGSAGSDEQAVLWDLPSKSAIRIVGSAHEDRLTSIAFSRDGRWVATGSIDKTVCIWRSRDEAFASRIDHLDGVQCVTFAPSGNLLASGDRGGAIQLWGAVENSWSLARDTWEFETSEVRWSAVSGDGRWVAAATENQLLLRDVQTREIRTLKVDPTTLQAEREEGHAGEIPFHVFSFSPSGSMLACVTEIHRSDPSAPRGWRLQTRLPEDSQNVSCVAFSPDDRLLATGLKDGSVALWDTETGQRRAHWKAHRQDTWVLDAAFSADGESLVTAGEDGHIVLWKVATATEKMRLEEQYHGYSSVALSPNGRQLAVGYRDEVRIWDLQSGKQCASYPGRNRAVSDVAFSPDGALLASTGDWAVRLWEVETGHLMQTYPATATFVSFTRDGKSLLAGGQDAFVRLWDLDVDKPAHIEPRTSLHAHQGRVYWLAFSPGGDRLASVGEGGRLIIWDPSPVAVETDLAAAGWRIEDTTFTPDGRLAAAAGNQGVHLLDATTGAVTATLAGSGEEWLYVAVSNRNGRLAAVSSAGTVSVWDSQTGLVQRTWHVGGQDGLHGPAFSPDGEMLAVCSWDDAGDAVPLFDVTRGVLLHTFPADVPRAAAFSPDGKRLVFDSQNEVLVWDVEARRKLFTLRGHRNSILAIAFSPDGRLIASGGKDRMVNLWDAGSGRRQFSLIGHQDNVCTLAFSPDGLTLVTADRSGWLKMWQVKTGQELLTLDRGPVGIEKVAFSPDGTQLACLFEAGNVRTIHISSGLKSTSLVISHRGRPNGETWRGQGRTIWYPFDCPN